MPAILQLQPESDLLEGHVFNDGAHLIANQVKNLLQLVSNNGQMKYSAKRRKCEMSYGRWKEYEPGEKMPWHFSNERQAFIDAICKKAKGRSEWSKMVMIFEKMKSMKIAHNLAFAGDIGLYFMQFGDCDQKFIKCFCIVLRCMREWQRRDITDEQLDQVFVELVEVIHDTHRT